MDLGVGIEPTLSDSKSDDLPLVDPRIDGTGGETRTLTPYGTRF